MDRSTRNLFVVALVVVLAVTGGAAIILGGPPIQDPDMSSDLTMVEGVIVGVEAERLDDVRSFRLRTASGQLLQFELASLENGDEFPPGHLAEHQVTAEAVRVSYREVGGMLLAIRVADAGT